MKSEEKILKSDLLVIFTLYTMYNQHCLLMGFSMKVIGISCIYYYGRGCKWSFTLTSTVPYALRQQRQLETPYGIEKKIKCDPVCERGLIAFSIACTWYVNMLSPWYLGHLSSLHGTMAGCNMKVIGWKHDELWWIKCNQFRKDIIPLSQTGPQMLHVLTK